MPHTYLHGRVGLLYNEKMVLAKPASHGLRPNSMRYSNTKARNAFLIFSALVAVGILWSAPSSGPKLTDEEQAAQALFGQGGDSSRPSSGPVRSAEPGNSLFDSGYMDSGVGENSLPDLPAEREKEYGDPEILDPVSKGNPVNPQTGQPFTDRQMAQFDKLRKKFPDNSVIPQRMTPEKKAAQEERRKEIYAIQARIVQKDATADEVNEYYDYQQKAMKDRMELIDYVLNSNATVSDEMRKKLEQVREMNQRSLKSYDDARTRALNALEN